MASNQAIDSNDPEQTDLYKIMLQQQAGSRFGVTDPGQGVNKFLAGDQGNQIIWPGSSPTDLKPDVEPWSGISGPIIPADATEQGGWNGGYSNGGFAPPRQGGLATGNDFTINGQPAQAAGAGGVFGGNYQQTYQQIMGGANDQATLLANKDKLEAAGFKISPANAEGKISKIQTPNGEWVRVIGEGEGHPVWLPQGNGMSVTSGSMGSSLTRPFGSGIDTSQTSPLFQLLMQRATQGLNVNPNDPTIRAGTDAFGATQERSRRSYLQDVAERGGPNANIAAETRSSAERAGQATAGYQAQMMQSELAARRQEISQALSLAAQQGNTQAQLQLQEELAQISLAQQAYQFDTNQEYLRSPLNNGATQ